MNNIKDFIPNQYCKYPNDATLPEKGFRGLNIKGKIKFQGILVKHNIMLNQFYKKALRSKKAAIGPFWGEFGNFLLHFLPFVMHLHKNGVVLSLCCSEQFAPFLKDENGNPIFEELLTLPKVHTEHPASGNSLKQIPITYQKILNKFLVNSYNNKIPTLDLSDANLYWYSFRNWQLKGKQHFYNLYKYEKKKNKVVLFPRKKGPSYTANNGEILDYNKICNILSDYFDEVTIIGQPEMSESSIEVSSKINYKLGSNEVVLKEVSEAQLIVSQHSGAIHMGAYTNTPSLIIFKGILPIKGLDDTLRFRENSDESRIYLVTTFKYFHEFLTDFKSLNYH